MQKPTRRSRAKKPKDDAEAGLAHLREDLEHLIAALGGKGTAKPGTADDGEKSEIAELLRLVLADAKGGAHAVEESLAERVREKPVLSLGIAAGLGFILAILLTARGR
jgi:ElaB/YqjD/DUF883 family membrane-anchored ribosome-binding protein